VEIRTAGSAGRGVFAAKDFEAGEVILASTPAVAHPSIDSIGKVLIGPLYLILYLAYSHPYGSFQAVEERKHASRRGQQYSAVAPDFLTWFVRSCCPRTGVLPVHVPSGHATKGLRER